MSSMKSKVRLIGALAALGVLALAISCQGFFVNPTLTGVSVGPQSLTLNIDETWQMSATGTYSDGSQKSLTKGLVWSSSDSTTVSVDKSSGIVTGVQIGSATITGAAGSCSACSGSTTVTVQLTGVNSVIVSPSSASATINQTTAFFIAKANGTTDVTNAGAIWTVLLGGVDKTSDFSLSFVDGQGEGFLPTTAAVGTYTVQATYANKVGTATLNVTN